MSDLLEKICGYVWGEGLIFLLLFTGIVYTLKLGFIQFRLFPFLHRYIRHENKQKNNGISQLKTVCMSLGTAMGTGNITGVAAAVAAGGAGAVFWMWISAFFGMAVVYAENSLSVTYSSKDCKGPMAYLSRGLRSHTLASVFAVFCMLAAFGMGGMVQVNAFTVSLSDCMSINNFLLASIIFVLIFIVISGGAQRIGTAAQALLPAASLLYAAVCIAVLFRFRNNIPDVFGEIFRKAFGIRQAAGGISGYTLSRAVSVGMKRGIFSNEAGLGSSPILHSAAESNSPELQGMWSMFEVFFDTIICCTLTAVTVLCASPDFSVSGAFSPVLGSLTSPFLAIETAVFAFCTIIGWYYCGETAFHYVSGVKQDKAASLCFAAVSSLGAVFAMNTIWTLSDIFNGLMAIPNLVGLILLINKVKKV